MSSSAARTHTGRVRTGNEDAYLVDPALGLFAVADGMGGHSGGEVASAIAIAAIAEFTAASRRDAAITWPYGLSPDLSLEANQLINAVQIANQHIRSHATDRPELTGMGSTLIAVLLCGEGACFVNIGDSRLYLWRRATLAQLSEDDSWAASMLRAGAPPDLVEQHKLRHVLTKALGSAPTLSVTPREVTLRDADVLLLCSDGLYGPLGDDGIERTLGRAGPDLDATASALIEAANAAGGPDNITAVLVRYDADAAPRADGAASP